MCAVWRSHIEVNSWRPALVSKSARITGERGAVCALRGARPDWGALRSAVKDECEKMRGTADRAVLSRTRLSSDWSGGRPGPQCRGCCTVWRCWPPGGTGWRDMPGAAWCRIAAGRHHRIFIHPPASRVMPISDLRHFIQQDVVLREVRRACELRRWPWYGTEGRRCCLAAARCFPVYHLPAICLATWLELWSAPCSEFRPSHRR